MICSELYDERHGRIPPSEMSFKQADSYVPPDSGLRGYAVDRHVHRPVCPGMDCIVQPMCYDQSLNRRRSHAALSVRWDEQNESTWDWSIRIASGERTSDFSNSICKARANWRIENMATTISNRSGGSLSAGVVNYHDVAGSAQPAGTNVPSLGLNSTQL